MMDFIHATGGLEVSVVLGTSEDPLVRTTTVVVERGPVQVDDRTGSNVLGAYYVVLITVA